MTTTWPAARTAPDFDLDPDGYPARLEEGGICCGGCGYRHQTVAAVRECHIITENEYGQQQAEIAAENAWLRHAEMGTPDTWHDEHIARLTEIYGYGPPPGY